MEKRLVQPCCDPASYQDRTKGRLGRLLVYRKGCVIWPEGTLSHHAWETPWSPILFPTCCSFSWSEWLSG